MTGINLYEYAVKHRTEAVGDSFQLAFNEEILYDDDEE